MREFIVKITGLNEHQAVDLFMNEPPNVSIGTYLQGMSAGFNNDWWGENPCYGGPNWGRVADAALAMVEGKSSLEMLIDVGYTLAHNGGPIFNKGMMYSLHNGYFLTILDVQRSGQIPELVLDSGQFGPQATPKAKEIVKLVHKALPEEFRGWVDWVKVKACSVSTQQAANYTKFVADQKKLHPDVVPTPKAVTKSVGGTEVVIVGEWALLPDVKVPVFKRVKKVA